ncbi:MAG: acetylxylan esterase [Clostridia bacterium]|nr:acetylxylan esterase [Clostridia bacterium]
MKDYCELVSECYAYNPEQYKEPDFDAFWQESQKLRREIPLNLEIIPESKDEKFENYHIYYDGCDKTRVHALMVKPVTDEKLSLFLNYHGFGWNGGKFDDFYKFCQEGFFAISIDVRGQKGETKDERNYSSLENEHIMTRGGADERDYYFRWVILDSLRAIDAGCSMDFWDGKIVAVNGASQGGALSLSMAALDDRVNYCLCDVPSNCDLRERVNKRAGSYGLFKNLIEEGKISEERVFKTLSYLDVMNMAEKITAHVLAGVGLRDDCCPPIQFFAAYNKIKAPKTVDFYYEGGHGDVYQYRYDLKINLLRQAKQKLNEK